MTLWSIKAETVRKMLGWGKSEISDRTGIPARTLYSWYSGRHVPKLDDAIRLARTLGVPMDDLYKDEREIDFGAIQIPAKTKKVLDALRRKPQVPSKQTGGRKQNKSGTG